MPVRIANAPGLYPRGRWATEPADLGDRAAEGRLRDIFWSARHLAELVTCLGLLVALFSAMWFGLPWVEALTVGAKKFVLLLATLCSVSLIPHAKRKSRRVSPSVRQALAVAACPLMVGVGLGAPSHGPVTAPLLTFLASTAGVVIALVVPPTRSTAVLQLVAGSVAILSIPLFAGHSWLTQAAALGGTSVLLAMGILPLLHDGDPDVRPRRRQLSTPDADGVGDAVQRDNDRQPSLLSCSASVVLLVAFLHLGASHNAFALALLGCMSVAVTLQASSLRAVSAVVPQLTAGAVGLTTLVVRLAQALFGFRTGWLMGLLAGLVVVGTGLMLGFGVAARPTDARGEPRRWPAAAGAVMTMVCVPLVVGVFGAYGALTEMGSAL